MLKPIIFRRRILQPDPSVSPELQVIETYCCLWYGFRGKKAKKSVLGVYFIVPWVGSPKWGMHIIVKPSADLLVQVHLTCCSYSMVCKSYKRYNGVLCAFFLVLWVAKSERFLQNSTIIGWSYSSRSFRFSETPCDKIVLMVLVLWRDYYSHYILWFTEKQVV